MSPGRLLNRGLSLIVYSKQLPSRYREGWMIVLVRRWPLAILAMASIAFAACGDDATSDPTPANTAVSQATASGAAASPSSAAPTAAPAKTSAPRTPGAPFTLADAQSLIEAAHLKPSDIKDLNNTWKVQTDNLQDNDAYTATAPEQAPLVEKCGRLLGRTVVLQPKDILTAFIGGETLSFFTQMTAYKDTEGASVCAADTAQRLAAPGALARQFGEVFVNPDAVIVTPVAYPATGDGSFAATLTGQSNAQGQIIDLTILVVGFKSGNVSAAVGSVRSGSTPPQEELKEYVDLVLQRIQEDQ